MEQKLNILAPTTEKHWQRGLERRTRIDCGSFEVNIFETTLPATEVAISYNGLSLSNMLSGSKLIHSEKGEEFNFLPGSTLVLAADTTIYADFPNANRKNPACCATILIPNRVLVKQLTQLRTQYGNQDYNWELFENNFHFNGSPGLTAVISELLRMSSSIEPDPALADILLKSLLLRTLKAQKDRTKSNFLKQKDLRIYDIKKYIREHLDQPIDLCELCKIGHISKSSLHRLFLAQCNQTPGVYILQQRMQRAANLLLRPGATVSEVALNTGYNSSSYFTKQFKNYFKCTPVVFIKKQGGRLLR